MKVECEKKLFEGEDKLSVLTPMNVSRKLYFTVIRKNEPKLKELAIRIINEKLIPKYGKNHHSRSKKAHSSPTHADDELKMEEDKDVLPVIDSGDVIQAVIEIKNPDGSLGTTKFCDQK